MPKVKIELDEALWDAIDEHRGNLSRGEFIERAIYATIKHKEKLNREMILKYYRC